MRFLNSIGLQYRIAGGVVLGLVALFVLFGFLALRTINESKDIALEERLRLAQTTAESVDALIQHTVHQLEATALLLLLDSDDPEREQMERQYHVLGTFDKIVRLDPQGQVLWTVPMSADVPSWVLADDSAILGAVREGKTAIVQASATETDHPPVAVVVTPVRDGLGAARGFLAGELHLSHAGAPLLPLPEGEEAVQAELVDVRGYILAHSGKDETQEPAEHADVLEALIASGRPGTTIHHLDGTSDHVVAYYPLASLPGGIVVEQREDKALALPRSMERTVLIFGLGALVVGSGAAWFHARSVVRPIQQLTGASERIAAGELDEPVTSSRGDEIGVLSRRFEQMRFKLKAAQEESRRWTEELEKRVRERTRELEALSRSRSELLGKVISAQEDERLRISRELHDETAQELVHIVRRLEAMGESAEPDQARRIDELLQMMRDTLKSVRRFSRDLRPAVLDDLGLVAAIEMVVEDTSTRLSEGASLVVVGESRRVDRTVELALFRIAQEALRNVERHSHATSATVRLAFEADEIQLNVSDNGRGFSPPRNLSQLARRGSLGLLGMKERAELVGGRFELQSSPGHGSELTVTVEAT